MTDYSHIHAPSTIPTQTQAAEVEAGVANPQVLRLGTKSWPLAASVSFVRAANIQDSLTNFNLIRLGDNLPSIVQEQYAQEVRDFLFADTKPGDPDHVGVEDVLDAWVTVQEILAARPTAK